MYTNKELLTHHRQLLSPSEAVADVILLSEKSPRHKRLAVFLQTPQRFHDEILLELLRVASRDEIVANRLRAKMKAEDKPEENTETEEPEEEAETKEPEAPEIPKAPKGPESPEAPEPAEASEKKTDDSAKSKNT